MYKVLFDNGMEFQFYEDVILEHQLLMKKEITEKDLQSIQEANLAYDVYYQALKSLKSRFKSVYEMKLWLLKKEYPEDLINQAIQKLKSQGYLNDELYAKSYLNEQLVTTSNGPYKIRRGLLEKKISEDIIDEVLENYGEEEQRSKINKIIEKKMKANHNKGGVVLRQKISLDLKNMGYEISLINEGLSKFDFSQDASIVKKEYEKLYRKYSKKYQGVELETMIKRKLYEKGLTLEEL